MKKVMSISAIVALILCAAVFAAQDNNKQAEATDDAWELPGATEQHKWLQKFVGEWTTDIEVIAPGSEPMKETGAETVRAIGDFWIIADMHSKLMGDQYHAMLTLGYDPIKEKFIGTYVDSMTSQLWIYEGELDESGNTLVLNTEGKMPDGSTVKFRESHEFKGDDHRVFTSRMLGPDGEYTEMLTVNAHRKK